MCVDTGEPQSSLGSCCPHYSISFHSPRANKGRFSAGATHCACSRAKLVSAQAVYAPSWYSAFLFMPGSLPRHPFVMQHSRQQNAFLKRIRFLLLGVFRLKYKWTVALQIATKNTEVRVLLRSLWRAMNYILQAPGRGTRHVKIFKHAVDTMPGVQQERRRGSQTFPHYTPISLTVCEVTVCKERQM